MTPTQVAVIVLRILGIGWFLDVLIALTNLPGDVLGAIALQSGYLATQRELALLMLLARLCLYLIIGTVFLFFPHPIARVVAKDVERVG